jgi:ATP phosphoribosyltransferase regulatory subunit
VGPLTVDMADARIVRALLSGLALGSAQLAGVHAALATKDATELATLTKEFPKTARDALQALIGLYGDQKVLAEAAKVLPRTPVVQQALEQLQWLAGHVEGARIRFDLADLRGYAYYSGMRFGIYTPGASDALVRGGRYDEVGAVFGRTRPAVGFSLDVKELVGVATRRPLKAAVRAPWLDAGAGANELRTAIAALRDEGETVVCVLPGHESEVDEFLCDRELALDAAGRWAVRAL